MRRRRVFQGGHPFSINPLAVQPQVAAVEVDLLSGVTEEDGVPDGVVGMKDGGDDAFPPAIEVEGVDLFAEAEGTVGFARRERTDEDDVDELPERLLGVLGGDEGIVLDEDLVAPLGDGA